MKRLESGMMTDDVKEAALFNGLDKYVLYVY